MSKKVDVQELYQYSMAPPHRRHGIDFDGASLTRQEFVDECDINALMARYEKTNIWPGRVSDAPPRYLDLTEVPDFRSAMDMMIEAEQAFMTLPAIVRKEFDNDPAKFVDYASDPENIGKMREWGLAPPEALPDAPMRVEVVNPPPADNIEPAKPGKA